MLGKKGIKDPTLPLGTLISLIVAFGYVGFSKIYQSHYYIQKSILAVWCTSDYITSSLHETSTGLQVPGAGHYNLCFFLYMNDIPALSGPGLRFHPEDPYKIWDSPLPSINPTVLEISFVTMSAPQIWQGSQVSIETSPLKKPQNIGLVHL